MRALISTPFFRGGRTVLKKEEVRDYEGLNVALATWYLQTLIDQFESDKNTLYTGRKAVRAALAAYNRGRREVLKYGLGNAVLLGPRLCCERTERIQKEAAKIPTRFFVIAEQRLKRLDDNAPGFLILRFAEVLR